MAKIDPDENLGALRDASLKAGLSQKTNQDIINAAYKVAEQLKLSGGVWPLLRAAGWGNLAEKRDEKYKGPAIDDTPGLTPEQKSAFKTFLGI